MVSTAEEGVLAVDGARLRTSITTSCMGDPGSGPLSSPFLDAATPVSPAAAGVLRPPGCSEGAGDMEGRVWLQHAQSPVGNKTAETAVRGSLYIWDEIPGMRRPGQGRT